MCRDKIEKFAHAFPFLDISTLEAEPTPQALEDLFTVNTIAALVCDALARAEVS